MEKRNNFKGMKNKRIMNIEKIYFEGRIDEILELSNDLKDFREGNLEKEVHAKMVKFEKVSIAFIYPLEKEGLSCLEYESIFKDFKVDLKNQTIKFDYNRKKYYIYQTRDIYDKRWQLDIEENLNQQ